MLEEALDKWVSSFKNKVDRHTTHLIAFCGSYFEMGGPASMFKGPFSSKAKQRRMKAQVARISRAHKVPALSRCNADGMPPKEHMKSWPVKTV